MPALPNPSPSVVTPPATQPAASNPISALANKAAATTQQAAATIGQTITNAATRTSGAINTATQPAGKLPGT